jgi:hypothetical protein
MRLEQSLNMLEGITHQSFESIIGETVDLKSGNDHFRATIEDVSLLTEHPSHSRQPFSVILRADDAQDHGQRVYQVSHPRLGVLDLFAVPIGPGATGMRYEIVFN